MYIDFKLLKDKLDVIKVINYLSIKDLKIGNKELSGPCPIHKGKNPTAFHFELNKKIFNCFACGEHGNILDFIAKMKNVGIHQAGQIGLAILGADNILSSDLGFRLKLNPEHPFLKNRNITPQTASHFGIGFCDTGYFKRRIAIPIHSDNSTLTAYAGRSIDDGLPKYLFPRHFAKTEHIYNYHRIINSGNDKKVICIVEGFFDVLYLYQLNIRSVAIMGCSLSAKQLELLKVLDDFYCIMFDGDKAGRLATKKIADIFTSTHLNYKTFYLPDDYKFMNLTPNILSPIL